MVVEVAPQSWALDLEPLVKTPVLAMMPLKGMFQWWRTLGVPEKGVTVGVAPQSWALDLEPLAKTPV